MRFLLALTLVLTLVIAAPAGASTVRPRQATKRIATCLIDHGALRVSRHGADGGTAYFGADRFSDYVQWSYVTVDGRVAGVATMRVGLDRKQRRVVNRCLRPYNGRA